MNNSFLDKDMTEVAAELGYSKEDILSFLNGGEVKGTIGEESKGLDLFGGLVDGADPLEEEKGKE